MLPNTINFVLFQIGWFACVLGASWGYPLIGPAFILAALPVHALLAKSHKSVWLLYLAGAVVGFSADSILVLTNVLGFTEPASLGYPTAIWMVALWVNLAATLHLSMRWLLGRYFLAIVFGLIGGPLAYWAGVRLGAVTLADPMLFSIAIVAVEWALAMPLLLLIKSFLDRWAIDGTGGEETGLQPAGESP